LGGDKSIIIIIIITTTIHDKVVVSRVGLNVPRSCIQWFDSQPQNFPRLLIFSFGLRVQESKRTKQVTAGTVLQFPTTPTSHFFTVRYEVQKHNCRQFEQPTATNSYTLGTEEQMPQVDVSRRI
jgi:hypothetical protein